MSKGLRALGHPLHAVLSDFPLALLGTSLVWDVIGIWRARATSITGRSIDAGHNLHEDAPDAVVAELRAFLRGEKSPHTQVKRGRFSRADRGTRRT